MGIATEERVDIHDVLKAIDDIKHHLLTPDLCFLSWDKKKKKDVEALIRDFNVFMKSQEYFYETEIQKKFLLHLQRILAIADKFYYEQISLEGVKGLIGGNIGALNDTEVNGWILKVARWFEKQGIENYVYDTDGNVIDPSKVKEWFKDGFAIVHSPFYMNLMELGSEYHLSQIKNLFESKGIKRVVSLLKQGYITSGMHLKSSKEMYASMNSGGAQQTVAGLPDISFWINFMPNSISLVFSPNDIVNGYPFFITYTAGSDSPEFHIIPKNYFEDYLMVYWINVTIRWIDVELPFWENRVKDIIRPPLNKIYLSGRLKAFISLDVLYILYCYGRNLMFKDSDTIFENVVKDADNFFETIRQERDNLYKKITELNKRFKVEDFKVEFSKAILFCPIVMRAAVLKAVKKYNIKLKGIVFHTHYLSEGSIEWASDPREVLLKWFSYYGIVNWLGSRNEYRIYEDLPSLFEGRAVKIDAEEAKKAELISKNEGVPVWQIK